MIAVGSDDVPIEKLAPGMTTFVIGDAPSAAKFIIATTVNNLFMSSFQ